MEKKENCYVCCHCSTSWVLCWLVLIYKKVSETQEFVLYNLKPSEPLIIAKTSYSSSHLLSSIAKSRTSFNSKANTNLDLCSFLRAHSCFSFGSLHFLYSSLSPCCLYFLSWIIQWQKKKFCNRCLVWPAIEWQGQSILLLSPQWLHTEQKARLGQFNPVLPR